MLQRVVLVTVSVGARDGRFMDVRVMPVVVRVGMLVFERLVSVLVLVLLSHVQVGGNTEERRREDDPTGPFAITEAERSDGSQEWSQGKQRARACRPQRALSSQVQA